LGSDPRHAEALQSLLGYLNFSTGRPDPRFQKTLAEIYDRLALAGVNEPWTALAQQLRDRLGQLQAAGSAAFRDAHQAESILAMAFDQVLPAYRTHHADLLFHLSDAELWQPFLVARVLESVLTQFKKHEEKRALVAVVLKQLNDYVGHRPGAILETRP
jgi:hypothetical protein